MADSAVCCVDHNSQGNATICIATANTCTRILPRDMIDYKLCARNTPSGIQVRESESWKLERNWRRQSLFAERDGRSAETKMHFPCTKPKDKLPSTHKSTVWPHKAAHKYTPYSRVLHFPLNLFTQSGFFPSFLFLKFCVYLASFSISVTYPFHIIVWFTSVIFSAKSLFIKLSHFY